MITPALFEALGSSIGPAETAMSLPPTCYTDHAWSLEEHSRIFATSWLGVGRADIVSEPGDLITLDFAEQSVILMRDRDLKLRAFANACRHRGARLLDGKGNKRSIRCPFHSWAYKLDGTLAAAPMMDAVPDFDQADYGLVSYRAEERLGFAFLCLDPSSAPLDEAIGDFEALHSSWPLEKLKTTRRRTLEADCNWKAFLEVFNEYYHLPYVHADSINTVYSAPDPADDVVGFYTSQFGETDGSGGLLQDQQDQALPAIPGLRGRAARGVRYTWVFPNMTFAAGKDALWVYEAYPLGPDRCQVVQTACFPPETLDTSGIEQKLSAYHRRLDAALDEDIPTLTNQHRGMKVPGARQGRFQPLLEHNVAAFADWYAQRMTAPEADRP